MASITPALRFAPGELEPYFVNERGGLKRLAGNFMRQPAPSEFAQFLINERQQFFRCACVALFNRTEDDC
jgi:hypothetical protein